VKRYLKLFVERIVITLPKVEIVGKTEAVLSLLENKTVLGTDLVPRTGQIQLPGTGSCKNFRTTLFIKGKQGVGADSASVKGRETAGLQCLVGLAAQ
jgi:hypothetical protein